MSKFLLFEIGCIECGCSSNVVGVFDSQEQADGLAQLLNKKAYWREGGQNSFEVFPLNEPGVITEEFKEYIE